MALSCYQSGRSSSDCFDEKVVYTWGNCLLEYFAETTFFAAFSCECPSQSLHSVDSLTPLPAFCHITFFLSSQVTSLFLYLCLFQYPFISLAFAPSPSICLISVLSFFSSFYKQSSLSNPIILLTVSLYFLSLILHPSPYFPPHHLPLSISFLTLFLLFSSICSLFFFILLYCQLVTVKIYRHIIRYHLRNVFTFEMVRKYNRLNDTLYLFLNITYTFKETICSQANNDSLILIGLNYSNNPEHFTLLIEKW